MVNANNQKDYLNYNSYYRPYKPDDFDDGEFIPSQGVLPLYYYEYGRLRGTVEPKQIRELKFIEEYEDNNESNNSILNLGLFLLLMYPLIKLVKKII
jgi:hypothetical protein